MFSASKCYQLFQSFASCGVCMYTSRHVRITNNGLVIKFPHVRQRKNKSSPRLQTSSHFGPPSSTYLTVTLHDGHGYQCCDLACFMLLLRVVFINRHPPAIPDRHNVVDRREEIHFLLFCAPVDPSQRQI